ncbi:MAG TPA: hypothetical protein VM915_09520 [Verrucomicrobiae bacterium]|jgi:ABC-type phosphate/phosphonate transport system permease subunit|nr:hypothetical protein [Verrucomicrobiae bacterium]
MRATLIIWALVSVGLGALAFAVVLGAGGSLGAATNEALETIPEAAMQMMGFSNSPFWPVVAYWLTLLAFSSSSSGRVSGAQSQ